MVVELSVASRDRENSRDQESVTMCRTKLNCFGAVGVDVSEAVARGRVSYACAIINRFITNLC